MVKKQRVKLTIIHAKCTNCGFVRTLYFLSDFSYGERIVTTKGGEYCAYVNLLDENLTEELKIICERIVCQKGLTISQSKLKRLISNIYPITCDDIEGMKIENAPNWKCPECTNGTMEEDRNYGEKLEELKIPCVTHNAWQTMAEERKKIIVEDEMKKQGYLI